MIFLTTLGFISWKIVLKFLPPENAQEYRQRDFLDILKHYGTISHTSFSSISQQNGCVESKLHHILQTVRALTIVASTPHFWEELLLLWYTPSISVSFIVLQKQTPYERLFGTTPTTTYLKFFVVLVLFFFNDMNTPNFNPIPSCCFLGHGIEQMGYRCYDLIAKCLRNSHYVVL